MGINKMQTPNKQMQQMVKAAKSRPQANTADFKR